LYCAWSARGSAAKTGVARAKRRVSASSLVGSDGDFLVEDDVRGLLALADVRAGFGPLLIGAPDACRVAFLVGGGPKGQDVDAASSRCGCWRRPQSCDQPQHVGEQVSRDGDLGSPLRSRSAAAPGDLIDKKSIWRGRRRNRLSMVACSPAAHGLPDKGAAYCRQWRLTAKDGCVMTDSDASTDVEFKRAQLAFEREKWQAEESWRRDELELRRDESSSSWIA
jgi:hypothetical protein